MSESLVITGMGAVTPVGIGVDNYWQGLLKGRCGICPITRIDTEHLAVKQAAQVKDFAPREYLPGRLSMEMDTFMQFAYVAAEEALSQSGLDAAGSRTAIVMGTALAGMALTGSTQQAMTNGAARIGPRFLAKIMGNMAACQLAVAHGITGPSLTVSTACASGGDAVVLASMLLNTGMADAVIIMAGESAVSPLLLDSLARAGALSRTGRSRPFDCDHDGFVVGEGGGALVLETAAHAKQRGAVILAELAGCGCNNDAYHPISPEPNGRGASECMQLALRQAGLSPEEIGYINAHGTATLAGDTAEAAAIEHVFGRNGPPVSSTKGATGHMMGAGGITELIACVCALQTGLLPQTVGCDKPAYDLNLVVGSPRTQAIQYAMSNAFGFGGQNSSVIIKKYPTKA